MESKSLLALKVKFGELFPEQGEPAVYFAPGRVNLIGEHTDYNGGHVFPCALDIGTFAAVKKRSDRTLRLFSMNMEQYGVIEAPLDDLRYNKDYNWANYVLGVIKAFTDKGYRADCGLDIVFYGNIPNASGLSSSASLEVLTGFVLKEQFGFDSVNMLELALIGQEAENKFIGVSCGIMDQFAVAMGKEGHAVCLDTSTLGYTYAPLHLDGVKIVIINTNKKRGLNEPNITNAAMNARRRSKRLKSMSTLKTSASLRPESLRKGKNLLPTRR